MDAKEFLENYDPQLKEVGYENYSYTPQEVIDRLNAFKKEECKTTLLEVHSDFFGDEYDRTSCCQIGPITDESYCPQCGAEIVS